jgi:HlyD family secretion protein
MNKKKLYKYLPAGLLGILIIIVAVWWLMPKEVPLKDRYELSVLERGPITQMVSANGTLNPVVLVNVGSQVSGIVKKLHADFNDHVKAGQILLELDPSLLQAQLRQSEANVESARASLDLAQANEKRTRDLYAKEYVSRQDLDTAEQALKSAEAQLIVAQAQEARDRTNLGYTVIRSPVSGVVVSRVVDVGQTVAASFQTPTLFTIAQDLAHMQIDTSYAEADVGNIRVGQPAEFRVDAFPNRVFHGVVRQVRLNPTTQQNVVTYDVVVTVDNPDKILMPGMTAYVNITVAKRDDALLVPNAALRFHPSDSSKQRRASRNSEFEQRPEQASQNGSRGTQGTVYILDGDELKPVRVRIGITDNRMSEVLSGNLKEGDQVVVNERQAGSAGAGSRRGMRLF